jgi:hypothetical protein
MQKDYWQRQEPNKPLYPDLLWSRPENRTQAGKLLIMGGNIQSFAAVATAYGSAAQAGIGTARVLLPSTLQKTVSSIFVGGEYAPSTPSGSFSKLALGEVLDNAAWSDGVMLAGDFGRNSETAILLERLAQTYKGLLCVTKDSIEYFNNLPLLVLDRENTLLCLSLSQLQKMSTASRNTEAVTLGMDLIRLADFLHNFSLKHRSIIITKHLGTIFVACNGQVTTTKLKEDKPIWRVETAAQAITWWLQNPDQALQAITTSLVS